MWRERGMRNFQKFAKHLELYYRRAGDTRGMRKTGFNKDAVQWDARLVSYVHFFHYINP